MENINTLKDYLNAGQITEQQAEFFVNLLNNNFKFDYRRKMDFMLSKEEQNKIDSATPNDLNNKLAEILPRDQFPQLAYDYREASIFGKYLNLDRLFITKMYSLFE